MKVIVQFGKVFLGEQEWVEGQVMEVSEELASRLGAQVKPVRESEPVKEPVREPVKDPVKSQKKPEE